MLRRLVGSSVAAALILAGAVWLPTSGPDTIAHYDPVPATVADAPTHSTTAGLYDRAGITPDDTDPTPGLSPLPGVGEHLPPSCSGTGTDGNRVQVVYAREADTRSRLVELTALLRYTTATIDDVFGVSATHTGGGRRVRWVHDGNGSDCAPDIAELVLPDGALSGGFGDVIRAVRHAGMNRTDRKYLLYSDVPKGCGIAHVEPDSTWGPANVNERVTNTAQTAVPCWVTGAMSVPAHELVHALGGVQLDAPNSSGGYHCTEEEDLMCYDDGNGRPTRSVCVASYRHLLDCGHDDYFNLRPAPDSYLDRHYNIAFSSYLDTAGPLPPATRSRFRVVEMSPAGVRFALGSAGRPVVDADVVVTAQVLGSGRMRAADGITDANGEFFARRWFRGTPTRMTISFAGLTSRRSARLTTRWMTARTQVMWRPAGAELRAPVDDFPLAGRTVVLQRRAGNRWVPVVRRRSNRFGEVAAVPRRRLSPGVYRWAFPGDRLFEPSVSRPRRVR